MLELVPRPCVYQHLGCDKEDFAGKLDRHEEKCDARPIRCPDANCVQVVPLRTLPDHLAQMAFGATTHAHFVKTDTNFVEV